MSCTLNSILADANTGCDESFSGVGSRIYLALVSDLSTKPKKADIDPDKAEFLSSCFASLQGHVVAWDIEEETGEATYETNAGGGGFTNKIEVTIRKNMHKVAHDLRILNNVKFLVFVPAAEGYYVYYSVNGSAKLESATGTTGKASNDEHGHTITVSAGPMYYPLMTWIPGIDLDNWVGTPGGSTEKVTITYTGSGFTVECLGTEIASGSKISKGSTLTVYPAESKKITAATLGSSNFTIASDGSYATITANAGGAISVTTASVG